MLVSGTDFDLVLGTGFELVPDTASDSGSSFELEVELGSRTVVTTSPSHSHPIPHSPSSPSTTALVAPPDARVRV